MDEEFDLRIKQHLNIWRKTFTEYTHEAGETFEVAYEPYGN